MWKVWEGILNPISAMPPLHFAVATVVSAAWYYAYIQAYFGIE